jgi:hypothetical protein
VLADDLCQAGAVMVRRGRRSVCAHFGSVGAEESVCRKHVGIALRSDLDVAGRAAGDDDPPVGRAVRAGAVWLARVAPERVLVIGPGAAPARDEVAISLAGPRAERLLARCGLPALGVADVRVCWWRGDFVVLLRESADRHLVLARAAHGSEVWHALLDAGRPLEIACVGVDALLRLAAAARE